MGHYLPRGVQLALAICDVNLSFYNRYTDEIIGDYMGQINLDSFEGKGDKLPDLISIDLGDSD